jgi:hypothetical protein
VTDDEKKNNEETPEEETEVTEPEASSEAEETSEAPAEETTPTEAEESQPEPTMAVRPAAPAPTSTDSSGGNNPFKGVTDFFGAIAGLPPLFLWGAIILVVLIAVLSLMAIEVPDSVSPVQLLETSTAEVETMAGEMESLSLTATAQAETAGELEDSLAGLEATATEQASMMAANAEALEALESEALESSVLATSEAFALNRMDNAATASAEEMNAMATQAVDMEATLTVVQEGFDTASTDLENVQAELSALSTEQAEMEDPALLQAQIDALREEITGFEAAATTRADQIVELQVTATAQADANNAMAADMDNMGATVEAQAGVVATQQAQLDTIRDALESLDGDG